MAGRTDLKRAVWATAAGNADIGMLFGDVRMVAPDLSVSEQGALLGSAVLELLDDGLIYAYRAGWSDGPNATEDTVEHLSREQVERYFAEGGYNEVMEVEGRFFWVAETERGAAAWPAAEESRVLGEDERALFGWFFDQWPELRALETDLAFDVPAEVFALSEDGYRTLSVPYRAYVRRPPLPSPYSGEARAEIDGHPFAALFFVGDNGVMLELIWSAGTWPGRLPRPDELDVFER